MQLQTKNTISEKTLKHTIQLIYPKKTLWTHIIFKSNNKNDKSSIDFIKEEEKNINNNNREKINSKIEDTNEEEKKVSYPRSIKNKKNNNNDFLNQITEGNNFDFHNVQNNPGLKIKSRYSVQNIKTHNLLNDGNINVTKKINKTDAFPKNKTQQDKIRYKNKNLLEEKNLNSKLSEDHKINDLQNNHNNSELKISNLLSEKNKSCDKVYEKEIITNGNQISDLESKDWLKWGIKRSV